MDKIYDHQVRDEEECGLVSNERKTTEPPSKTSWIKFTICSFVSNLLLVTIILAQFALRRDQKCAGNYENGFISDLEPARKVIELVQIPFSGQVHAHKDGTFFNDTDSPYVGPPSESVDKAWYNLLIGLNIDLPRKESPQYFDTYSWEDDDTFFSGLGVFHSLHCLNRLRQAMDLDYYGDVFSHGKDPSVRMHINHCIDHLRQSIQCHGDLTPMKWEQIGDKVILKTDTKHTCRNFEMIHAWAKERRTDFDSKRSVSEGRLSIVD